MRTEILANVRPREGRGTNIYCALTMCQVVGLYSIIEFKLWNRLLGVRTEESRNRGRLIGMGSAGRRPVCIWKRVMVGVTDEIKTRAVHPYGPSSIMP